MATIGEIRGPAEEMLAHLTTWTRDNGEEFVTFDDDRAEWMQDAARAAHGDYLPDDWRYQFIREVLSIISDADSDADAAEAIDESLEADIYTAELLRWVSSRNDRLSYCDEAAEEYGEDFTTEQRLSLGQLAEMRETASLLVAALESVAIAR